MSNILIFPLILVSCSLAASPPILNRPLVSQLVLDNPAISSVFLIPASSALVFNASISNPALRVPPSWSFSIGFSGATFLPAHDDPQLLSFAAQLDDGNPLPEWLKFAQDTITFGGVAPRQDDVQVLNIVVSATGRSSLSTSDKFTLIVAPHDLSLSGPLLTRNVTAETKFSFVIDDWQGVQVDGANVHSVSPDNAIGMDLATSENTAPPLVLAINTVSFPWLTFDPTSRTLTGTPPASYIGAPGPSIPALVTLAFPPQFLTVTTNLTLEVVSSAFTVTTLPPIVAPPGTQLTFSLPPFLSSSATAGLNISMQTDPLNATWLNFDEAGRSLRGTVPTEAPPSVRVWFTARDAASGTVSRADMVISIDANAGSGNGRTPTDRALRKTGKKVGLAVGLVCGVLAAIILLASFLAICRRCCAAHEHVDGAYVIDQSAFDEGLKGSGAYEKGEESDVDGTYLAPPPRVAFSPTATEGRMITKAAFFSAVRERFGSDGSWRGRRTPNSGLSAGGSGRRARKSKISKPMVVLSSSTSVRDGFADRARGGLHSSKNGPGFPGANFTIFGNKNNAHGSTRSSSANASSSTAPSRPPRADVSLSLGRVLMSPSAGSSPGTATLPYDRSRSNSDPSQNSASVDGSGSAGAPRSGSAPSMGTVSHSLGTQTGTQSTFATGDSARLTNAAGEVPFRRPGFDGRRETLGERSIREMGSPGADRSPGPIFPPRALLNVGEASPTPKVPPIAAMIATTPTTITPPKVPLKAALKNERPSKPLTPPKQSTPPKSSKSNSPPKAGTNSNKDSPTNPSTSTSSKFSTPLQPGVSTKSPTPLNTGPSSLPNSQPGSQRSLPAPSSYRNVFGSKDNESDGGESSIDDVEHAVMMQRTSNETMAQQASVGKPRLVAFTHERTPAASGQALRRDVSQRVVLQGTEDGDPEAEMRMGLEYVRQLGHPDSKQEVSRTNAQVNTSTSRISFGSEPTQTPSAEFYASNDSNGSIAGRTRVVSHLMINSHRHRHQTGYSTESTHDSFVSTARNESGSEAETRWMVEAELPRIIVGAGEWFEFSAPLDRTHKHASALAGSALEAKQTDGRALPEWLRFKKGERHFWGVAPHANAGDTGAALVTRVVVNIWESEKSEVVGGCVVDVVTNE